MRKAFLKKARETLESMRAQMLKNVQQELQEGRDQNKDEGMDTYDLASDARDREISHILTDRDRGKLEAIDEALSRVDDKQLRPLRGLRRRDRRRAPPGAPVHPALRDLPVGSRARVAHEQALRRGPDLSSPRVRRRGRRRILSRVA
jgi:hypothetical protein